jgi:membrane fusion protein, multidrug efflux system
MKVSRARELSRRMGGRVIWILAIAATGILGIGCKKTDQAAGSQPVEVPAAPVTAGIVECKTMPIQYRTFGTVEASATVEVKSQIAGELVKVHFVEGQMVEKDSPLFTIDPRPYEATLSQAKANLVQAQAQAENARREEQRAANLLRDKVMPQEQYDQRRTAADVAEAAVKAFEAAVNAAQLQLSYCSIRSPITGQTGSLQVDAGNLIKVNDVTMLKIHQIKPIYVVFSMPQEELSRIRQNFAQGRKMPVIVNPAGLRDVTSRGELTLIENEVDARTGTVNIRGTFANEDVLLWPGEHVETLLIIAEEAGAIVVPSQAVQSRQSGPYVFVIRDDQTVEDRTVAVDRTVNGETVISQEEKPGVKTLKPGEKIVTDGHLRLVPGSRVSIKNDLKVSEVN